MTFSVEQTLFDLCVSVGAYDHLKDVLPSVGCMHPRMYVFLAQTIYKKVNHYIYH